MAHALESLAESTVVVDVEQTPRLEGDFEQRRAIAAARARLFGGNSMPTIGRYAIERRIGRGGMGEVYRGIDPELGRAVAIKRLREDVLPASEHGRLLDEARALAKISHPNVVGVYEVGVHEQRAFVAMEYVEGETLRTWVKQPRSWQQLLAVHVAAGRGLAAAHAAGIVHRDFKPDNVLIGKDGRVRVADFGLALGLGSQALHEVATQIAGTVRYMSPEQLRGDAVDARSDQFSFCVVLYEALWGLPPFELGDARQRLAALEADEVVRPPAGGVPRSLWPVLRRGLLHDPARRWPSIDALLDELEALPRRRRRRLVAAIALPLALGVALLLPGRAGEPCEGVPSELARDWSPTRRERVESTLAATAVPHAQGTAARVGERLDAWAGAWSMARTEQCQAAAQQRDTPAQSHARRRCLERQRSAFTALVDALDHADTNAVDQALVAVDQLPEPDACALVSLLDGEALVDAPPGAQVIATRLQRELAQLHARRSLGRADPAAARATLARARSLGHRGTIIDALAELAHDEIAAGSPARGLQLLDEATELAVGSGDHRRQATTMLDGALYRVSEYPSDDAALRLQLAEAAWLDASPDARTQTRLAFAHARLSSGEQASAHLQRALETARASQRPAIVSALAVLSDDMGERTQALSLYERAVGLAVQHFGPLHPETATQLFNLGVALRERGQHERARPLLERAATLWMRAHARPHPNLARAHLLLADAAIEAMALDRAEHHARMLMAIHAVTLPAGHHDHGIGPMLLSRVAGQRGDAAAALRYASLASQRYAHADGPRADTVLEMRIDIASNRFALGDAAGATREYQQILALSDAPSSTTPALLGLAEIALVHGRLDHARALLERVESIGIEQLGGHRLSYAIIDGLVELRDGCRSCAATSAAHIDACLHELDMPRSVLTPWLTALGLSADEATLLGLSADADLAASLAVTPAHE